MILLLTDHLTPDGESENTKVIGDKEKGDLKPPLSPFSSVLNLFASALYWDSTDPRSP